MLKLTVKKCLTGKKKFSVTFVAENFVKIFDEVRPNMLKNSTRILGFEIRNSEF